MLWHLYVTIRRMLHEYYFVSVIVNGYTLTFVSVLRVEIKKKVIDIGLF